MHRYFLQCGHETGLGLYFLLKKYIHVSIRNGPVYMSDLSHKLVDFWHLIGYIGCGIKISKPLALVFRIYDSVQLRIGIQVFYHIKLIQCVSNTYII